MALTVSPIMQKLLDIRRGGNSDENIDRQEEADAFTSYSKELKESGKLDKLTKQEEFLFNRCAMEAMLVYGKKNIDQQDEILNVLNQLGGTTSKKVSIQSLTKDGIKEARKNRQIKEKTLWELRKWEQLSPNDFDTVAHQREFMKKELEKRMELYKEYSKPKNLDILN